jgi:transposase-like protein
MLGQLVKAVLERALEAELTAHLGYGKHDQVGNNSGNSRNGRGKGKTVQTGVGPVRLSVPRDRAGTFEPVLVPKRAGRVAGGLDDMIISLYAHGMSVRDILHHLKQVYGTDLSHEQVSRITDQVMDEVKVWQTRPLDPVYAVVFLDALVVKVRDNHVVTNKPAYVAVGIDADGEKHVLGIWLARTPPEGATAAEGARFWGQVMTDLRNRGVRDILIACCDGLKGFEDAIGGAFPATIVQTCVVHWSCKEITWRVSDSCLMGCYGHPGRGPRAARGAVRGVAASFERAAAASGVGGRGPVVGARWRTGCRAGGWGQRDDRPQGRLRVGGR